MKRFSTILVLLGFLFIPSVYGFRDINVNSKSYPAVQSLTERGLFKNGTFFRPNAEVPANMFWEIVIKDSGFDENSATFNTSLPPNIDGDDPLAQILREAIRRGFIDSELEFDKEKSITRIEAIKVLVKTKGIPVQASASKAFVRKLGRAPQNATYLPSVEAAYASKMIENRDISNLNAHKKLSRSDLARWIYNFNTFGIKKSTINPRGQLSSTIERRKNNDQTRQYPYMNRNSGISVNNSAKKQDRLLIPNGNIFQDIFYTIEKKYRFSEELTDAKKEKLIDGAIKGMVKALGDKYSSYIEPEESDNFKEDLNGKFEGIGAYIELINDDFTITAPIKDSPAMKAGILAGDVVISVDGESIIGKPVAESIKLIKGPAGTNVKLTIIRNKITKIITVVRGKIVIPSITVKHKESVPIIGIHKFTRDTKTEFKRVLEEEVLSKNPRGIILDLRNDPGGLLTSAVDMGEFLAKKGDILFSVDYRAGKQEFRSSRNGELSSQRNIVVLQNKGTASASEIFTAMVQDYDLGTIIGTVSVGKGSVQEVINYKNRGILKLTVAKWLSPKGRWIQEDKENPGVIPDIEISDPTPEEIKKGIDRQLDRAIQHILGR